MYSADRADKVIRFVASLYLAIGLQLPKYHQEIIRGIYGDINDRGTRIKRRALISVPRKAAKSTLCAALAIYHAVADGEPQPRIYIAATTLKQAGIIFDIIRQFVEAVPFLNRNFVIRDSRTRKDAVYFRDGKKHAVIEALAGGDPKGKKHEGLNPSLILADELGRWGESERAMWDSITSGSGARLQGLTIMISTSAEETVGIFWEQYSHTKKVLAGQNKDDELYGYILEADPDRWMEPEEWLRVNPLVNEGFVPVENLHSEYQKGLVSDHEMRKFRVKILNMWEGHASAFLNMDRWHAQTATISDADLVGMPCVAGLDLSRGGTKGDLTALVLLFSDKQADGTYKYYVRPYFWLPEDGIHERQKKDGQPYDVWVEKGLLYLSPGSTVDYQLVVAKIKEISTIYRIKEVAYDEWMAEYPVQDLDRAGFRLAPVKNNAKGMTAPMRELESLVLNSQLVHGCNPILTWNAQNLGAKEDDATGSLKPMKSNRASKNDGMLALMFALSTTLRHQANPPRTSTALERILAGRDKAA